MWFYNRDRLLRCRVASGCNGHLHEGCFDVASVDMPLDITVRQLDSIVKGDRKFGGGSMGTFRRKCGREVLSRWKYFPHEDVGLPVTWCILRCNVKSWQGLRTGLLLYEAQYSPMTLRWGRRTG